MTFFRRALLLSLLVVWIALPGWGQERFLAPSDFFEDAGQVPISKFQIPKGASRNLGDWNLEHGASPAAVRAALLYGPVLTDSSWVQVRDPWLAFDKAQHAAFSFFWTLGSQYALVNKLDFSERGALPLSVGMSAAVGLAKEYYDWRVRTGYFSRRDLVADAAGILLAVGLISL